MSDRLNENNNSHDSNVNSGPHVPNMNVVKGVLAIIFGLMFIVFAAKVILSVIFFVAGVFLVYYGLHILNIKQVTDYADFVFAKIKGLF